MKAGNTCVMNLGKYIRIISQRHKLITRWDTTYLTRGLLHPGNTSIPFQTLLCQLHICHTHPMDLPESPLSPLLHPEMAADHPYPVSPTLQLSTLYHPTFQSLHLTYQNRPTGQRFTPDLTSRSWTQTHGPLHQSGQQQRAYPQMRWRTY